MVRRMADLIEDDAPGGNAPEFSVSEISGAVKRVIEGEFPHVRVRGELGRVSRPRSGHVYLDLKDERAVLSGVIWRGVAGRLATQPEEGLEVVATGRLTTFPGQSRYQLVIEDLRPAGQGALMALLEQRKKALAAEGLFEEARKRALPYLPEVIGVVTSPSGAVIRDILHRLRDRFPRRVLIWPVAVQGAACAPEVANAIRGCDALAPGGAIPRPDLLIVARGGGSIEDLWGFNEEIVVRAAAMCSIPLISAVGHETDTTLIDHAADLRAPTPTGAAERAVPVRMEVLAQVREDGARLAGAANRLVQDRRTRLEGLARGLPDPRRLLEDRWQRLDDRAERLANAGPGLLERKQGGLDRVAARLVGPRELVAKKGHALAQTAARLDSAMERQVTERRHRYQQAAARLRPADLARAEDRGRRDLESLTARFLRAAERTRADNAARLQQAERLLESMSYERVLDRGFALVRDGEGRTVKQAADAVAGARWDLTFRDGAVAVTVGDDGTPPPDKPDPKPKPKPAPKKPGSGESRQGRLL